MNSDNGDCYIIPTDFIEIAERQNLTTTSVEMFKERWKLFTFGTQNGRLTGEDTRDGLRNKELPELQQIGASLGIVLPTGDYKIPGTRKKVSDDKEKWILLIWKKLCE